MFKSYNTLLALMLLSIPVAGCEGTKKVVEKTGVEIGDTTASFFIGLGKGFQVKRELETEMSIAAQYHGLDVTTAYPTESGITIYMTSENKFPNTVVVKALDEDEKEIGRATCTPNFKQDDANYLDLSFPEQMQITEVREYLVDVIVPVPNSK